MKNTIFIVALFWALMFAYIFGETDKSKTTASKNIVTYIKTGKYQDRDDSTIDRTALNPEKMNSPQSDSGSYIDCFVLSSSATEAASEDFQILASAGLTVMGSCASASFSVDQGFWRDFESGEADCCLGFTGNVDCSEEEEPDISDITRLIDFLYISHAELCCPGEADADVSGGEPDISDITRLIDYLYISHEPLALCP